MKNNFIIIVLISIFLSSCVGTSSTGVFGTGVTIDQSNFEVAGISTFLNSVNFRGNPFIREGYALRLENGFKDEESRILNNDTSNNANLVFQTGSGGTLSERLRIKSNGYVGIGTNNPQRPFVISNSGAAGVEFNIPDGNGGLSLNLYNRVTTGYDPLTFNAGYFVFGVNAIEKARFDSSGRLLIGTTTEGHPAGDNLTIADSGHAGITIRSGTTSNGALYFSDGTSGSDEYRGVVIYHHDCN